jgi:hypothetical protein
LNCTGDKALAVREYRQKTIRPFHILQFKKGHNYTDFLLWARTKESYEVKHKTVMQRCVLAALLAPCDLEEACAIIDICWSPICLEGIGTNRQR